MLAHLGRLAHHPDQAQRVRAGQLAFGLGFGALALPGLVLGGLYALTRTAPAPLPLGAWAGLLVLGLVLGALPLRLARRHLTLPQVPPLQARLAAALQAGNAPGVPFVLGCALLGHPPVALSLWLAAGLLGALAWRWLARLAPPPARPEASYGFEK